MAEAEAEKLDALKRAYAEMILNTAKEAASRVMASEIKARRLEQNLISTKEEASRMLLRLKQMIDRKTKETEATFSNQQRKVDELECQLDEAEGIILELRAELNEAQEQLDQAKHKPVLSLRRSETGKVCCMAAKDNTSGFEQSTVPLVSGPELLNVDRKHFGFDKRSPDVNSECHVYSVDSHQNLTPIKEPDMSRNGCTQAVHTTEMNIVSEDLPLGEKLDSFEDSTNIENMNIVGRASVFVDNVPHGKIEDVSVVRRSIRKRKLKHWDEVMSACSHQFKKARLAVSSLSCCKSKKVRHIVDSNDKLKPDGKTQIGKSLDCLEENPNDELMYNVNPPDPDIELIGVVKQDEHDAMFRLDNASKFDCDVNCAIATEASNLCCDDRERVFKYTFSRKRKDSMIYPESTSSPADSPVRKSSGVKHNGISGFESSKLLTKSSLDCRGLAQVAHQLISLSGRGRTS